MLSILNTAPVAAFIFAITVILSIYTFNKPGLFSKLMLHPYDVSRGKNIYQVLTSGFIHKDWSHLLFNMLSFYFFAFNLERVIGHWQFGLLYLGSLILCDIPSIQKHKNHSWYASLGASGAVCAVVFSSILFFPFSSLIIFPIPLPIPAILYGIIFLAYTSYAGKRSSDGINHDAHFFGAIAGIIITILLYPQVISHFLGEIRSVF
ncbi:Rhomboid family protein [Pseudopedobacter saltans DSM 12145]|uniref:Rhomboid family protein n=1 Tax=Pseudopedobacter saltans (strain ATCC 51119 / DSM 12145 / JCM 21818 / CCUG 39354 / LMG 10337 / NBRC 100064 / NCIMB 13643) TaxID=762903 RepID=F0S8A8_PSESL|nr:rhomboid family intramembrane serine protease [Pseudopedobacter saltans]ADY53372.1 Rhomboid family protein [Pseudopedobacter saltans DSM 12145]